MSRVFAVVVTYKRPDVLKSCLQALLDQHAFGLERIHVVVNSDEQATVDVIQTFSVGAVVTTFEKHDNVGPAGGFHYGLKAFLESNCTHVWLLDDDVIVQDNCLHTLLHENKTGYIYPRVFTDAQANYISFGWSAVLLNREIVEEAGLPIKDLFYWAEDTEYLQDRIMRKLGYNPLRSVVAVVNHMHQVTPRKPSWYYYYSVRNTIYYRTYIAGYTWYRFKRTVYLLPYSLYTILFKERNKGAKLILFIRGVWDGIFGRIGKSINPPSYP